MQEGVVDRTRVMAHVDADGRPVVQETCYSAQPSVQCHVHWVVILETSGERAEDALAFSVGSELSQSNPGGFESVLGKSLKGFNAGRWATNLRVLYVVKTKFWRRSLRNDPKLRDSRLR